MIKFSNFIYYREHEKQPRGVGQWAFMLWVKNGKATDELLTKQDCPFKHYSQGNYVYVWANGVKTLSEAKKEVGDWFRNHGYWNGTIYVAD